MILMKKDSIYRDNNDERNKFIGVKIYNALKNSTLLAHIL